MAGSNNKSIIKREIGRPTVIDDECVRKLESVFQLGVNDQTACLYAGISRDTFYDHIKHDQEFSDKMALAKEYARIAAGQVVVQAINNKDVNTAKWWLEKKYPQEFGGSPQVVQQINAGGDMKLEFIGGPNAGSSQPVADDSSK